MNCIKSKSQKTIDYENDLNENLNINNETKTSGKVINLLVANQINTDSSMTTDKNIIFNGAMNSITAKDINFFPSKATVTKKELRKTVSEFFKSRKSITNNKDFRKSIIEKKRLSHYLSSNVKKNDIKEKKNSIEYKQLFFEDDMFIQMSSSFSNEYEEDFLLKLKFIEDNDYKDDIVDYSIRNNSVSYKMNNEDDLHIKFFSKKTEKRNNTSVVNKINNIFFNEKELINKNIIYVDKHNKHHNNKNTINKNITSNNTNDLKDWIMISDKGEIENKKSKAEPDISFISLNLLIKKIALEDFRTKYYKIYKCFLHQFKSFISITNFVDRISTAFFYYNKSLGKYPFELVKLLNKIILKNNITIREDEIALEHIQNFYSAFRNIKCDSPEISKEIILANNLLFNYNKNDKVKSNKINDNSVKTSMEEKSNSSNLSILKSNKKNEEKEKKNKYNYFYIFDYKKEEIAAYLTNDCFNLMKNISENELFNKNFCRKDKKNLAPNVTKIIERCDKLILFIIEDICSYDYKSERIEVIEKWIRIAYVLKDLKNYNDLVMLSGLFYNYLLNKKLKKTWSNLSKKQLHCIDQIKRFCSNKQCYINIRREISKCKGPYIPYLGIVLKEIMTTEEMEYIIDDKINVEKLFEMDKIVERFFEFKKNKKEYSFNDLKPLDILSNINPKKENEIEFIINNIEPNLNICAQKGNKKRITKTDELFYK